VPHRNYSALQIGKAIVTPAFVHTPIQRPCCRAAWAMLRAASNPRQKLIPSVRARLSSSPHFVPALCSAKCALGGLRGHDCLCAYSSLAGLTRP
jgi:hypothetical protein